MMNQVVMVASIAGFYVLGVLLFALASRWRKHSWFGQLWHFWSVQERIEWTSYVLSTIHAIIATAAGIIALMYSWNTFQAQPFFPETRRHKEAMFFAFNQSTVQDMALMLTTGYLIVDLVVCLLSGAVDVWLSTHDVVLDGTSRRVHLATPLTLLHHSIIICAFSWGVWTHTGTFYMTTLLLNEISTPLLNFNYFLCSGQLTTFYPRLYVLNAIVLFIVFIVVRVVVNLMLLMHLLMFSWVELGASLYHDKSQDRMRQGVVLTLLFVGHVLINLVWASQLSRAVYRKWKRGSRNTKKLE